jgi:hypothetical protein
MNSAVACLRSDLGQRLDVATAEVSATRYSAQDLLERVAALTERGAGLVNDAAQLRRETTLMRRSTATMRALLAEMRATLATG